MSALAKTLATELKAEVDSKSYLPVWLKTGMAELVEAFDDDGTTTAPTGREGIDSLEVAQDAAVWTRSSAPNQDYTPPFVSRAFEILQQGNQFCTIKAETYDGSMVEFTANGGGIRPLAIKRIIADGTTAPQIMFYK